MSQLSVPAPVRVWFRDVAFYRRIWVSNVLAAFVQPMLYLLGVGIGVGTLVDEGPASSDLLGGVSYFAFYATALLATTAMFTASQDALWPTMDGFMWSNAYRAMVATPIEPGDVATGIVLHHAARTGVGAIGVATVLALFAETRSWGLVAAIPVAVLCGLAFAMPLTAWSSTRTTDSSFPAILRFAIIPMFLFGGAFYPVSQLPGWLQPIAWITPLWHAVELCRGLVLGGLSVPIGFGHLAVLAAFAIAGWIACQRTFRRRLHP
jgi:lipooligosaccharide transport system permease protein